jgi:hypothetical protein
VATKTLVAKENDTGLDINACPIPVKTDVGQVDLVSRLSDGTSEKMTVLPFRRLFSMIKMCCCVGGGNTINKSISISLYNYLMPVVI